MSLGAEFHFGRGLLGARVRSERKLLEISIVENQHFFNSIFRRVFTNKFLDTHIISKIVFDPENRILAKKFKFSDTYTSGLAILGDPLKITKNGQKSSKMPFWPF